MPTMRFMVPRFFVLTIFAALIRSMLTRYLAKTKCTITDAHNVIDEWRANNDRLNEEYNKFEELLQNFGNIESNLSEGCDELKYSWSKTERFLGALRLPAQISKLNHMIYRLHNVCEGLKLAFLKKRQDNAWKIDPKIRSSIHGSAGKLKEFQGTVVKALQRCKDAGGKPITLTWLDKFCTSGRNTRDIQRKLVDNIEKHVKRIEQFQTLANTFNAGVIRVTDLINNIFKGPIGNVLDEVDKVLSAKISLPSLSDGKEGNALPNCSSGHCKPSSATPTDAPDRPL